MLNKFNLKEAEPLKGFNLEGMFFEHLVSMRYNNIFTRITNELMIMTQITQRRRRNMYVMIIWSPNLVQTLNENKIKQGKEGKVLPMCNILLTPCTKETIIK